MAVKQNALCVGSQVVLVSVPGSSIPVDCSATDDG